MNWKIKNLAFYVIDSLPFGGTLHRLAQRIVSRRYYHKITDASLKSYAIPVEAFREIEGAKVALEFGAGRALTTPLLLGRAGAGAERVYALDLHRLASLTQINASLSQLNAREPGRWPPVGNFDELREKYGVDYRAPGDARDTGLPDQSVDLIYSTATLEHIPEPDIEAILHECARILRANGRLCFTIDYHDHYASSDKSIGFMNFYRFSDEEWKRYSPPSHYQNRLRHSEFINLFERNGWNIVESRPIFDTWSETDLAKVPLAPRFQNYSHEDLVASNGFFLLSPPSADAPINRT